VGFQHSKGLEKARRALRGHSLMIAGAALVAMSWQDASYAQQDNAIETVTVTGTRIPRPEVDMPNPVQSVTAEDIVHSGTTNLTDYLKRIPALTASLSDIETSGINTNVTDAGSSLGGLNLLNLRNLGFDRTLVLEDGQRLVSSSTGDAGVDVDAIPITLIDRVDTVTGGSSAIYGADGVTGVVNFVLKHDLEGVDARIQAGGPQDGGASKYIAAVSAGHNFDDGRGNIELTFETSVQDHLNYTQRKSTNTGTATFFVPNPDNPTGSDPTLPANIVTANGYIAGFSGIGVIDPLDGSSGYLGNGQPYSQPGPTLSNEFAIGTNGLPLAVAFQGDLLPNQHRDIAQLTGDYEVSRWFKVTGEFRFSHVDTSSLNEPPILADYVVTDQNPFLPANVAAAITANGSAGLGPDGSAIGILQEYPYLIPGMTQAENVQRNTYRGVLTAEGDVPLPDFFRDARYAVNYVYGQTDVHDNLLNDLISDRFVAALDAVKDPATGKATCRTNLEPDATPPDLSALVGEAIFDFALGFPTSAFPTTFTPGPNSGCVPLNLFDPAANNAAAIKFATGTVGITGYLQQQDLNGYVTFDLPQVQDWLGLPKPIGFVLGGEWRKEESASSSPTVSQQAVNPGLYFDPGPSPVSGRFQVVEGFGEANIPLAADRPLLKELTLDLAGRVSSYDIAGNITTNDTWKLGVVYSPLDGIRFRGSDAVAVRAPNIGELFAPPEAGFQNISDPCDAANINAGTQYRKANCQAIEDMVLGPGVYDANDPAKSQVATATTIPTLISGNDKLAPETARTWTAGVVINPAFLPDFIATIDYYRVNIVNAIEAPSAQAFADQCVDLSTIDNPFCANVTRSAGGNPPGSITLVRSSQINVALFYTAGVDFTAFYHVNLSDWVGEDVGNLDFHIIGNHLDKIATTALPGQAPADSTDEPGSPLWQFNLDVVWAMDRWTVDYNVDWHNGVLNTSRQALLSEPNILPSDLVHAYAREVHSIQVSYDVTDKLNLYVGVDNLFYQVPSPGNSNTDVDVSPLGRFFYAGLRINTGDFSGDLGL